MKFRRRRSLMPRVDWRGGLEHTEPLKGQLWTRSEQALREPDVNWTWRGPAVGAAGGGGAPLARALFGPARAVQAGVGGGGRPRTTGQVGRAAGRAARGPPRR